MIIVVIIITDNSQLVIASCSCGFKRCALSHLWSSQYNWVEF